MTTMALIDEILAGGFDLQHRDDGAIAAALSVGRIKTRHVPIADLQAYMQSHGIWWALKAAAADPAHPGQGAAAAVIEVASARYDNVDIALSFVGYVFGALVTAGLMTDDDLSAIQAMSVQPDVVTAQDVARALEGV